MSHEIFGNRAGFVREPAWHGLGTVFEEPISAVAAVEAVGMDFTYSLEPVIAAVKGADGKRTALRIPNKSAIVREAVQEGGPEVMGIVSDNYEIIQNVQFAQALDNLTLQWPLETLGALKGGRTVFFVLKCGETKIGESEIQKYFLVTDSKTGKESVRFMYTPVRVVCQNTLLAALSESAVQGTIVHRQGAAQEFAFRTGLMSKLVGVEQRIDEAFEAMTKAVLTIQQRDLIFRAYWPQPKQNARMQFMDISEDDDELRQLRNLGVSAGEEFERLVNRAAAVHSQLVRGFEQYNDQHEGEANTAWAAYNVCVEHAQYDNSQEMTQYASLFGDRARRVHAMWPTVMRMV